MTTFRLLLGPYNRHLLCCFCFCACCACRGALRGWAGFPLTPTLWYMALAFANVFDCFLVFCPVDSTILLALLPSVFLFLLPAATFPITQLSAPLQPTTLPWVPLSSTCHAFHQRHHELLLHLFFSSGFSGHSLSLLTAAYSLWSFNTFPCYTTPCLVFRFWVNRTIWALI